MKYKVGDRLQDGEIIIRISKIENNKIYTELLTEWKSPYTDKLHTVGSPWHRGTSEGDIDCYKLLVITRSHLPKWW